MQWRQNISEEEYNICGQACLMYDGLFDKGGKEKVEPPAKDVGI
jgi:hypothetical protein